MNITEHVLELLRNGQTVSGEEIAQRLGISRNAVWKAVQKLRQEQYEIEAATNKGYRLVSESGVLSAENIRRCLGPGMDFVAIEVRDVVSSTNTVLKELAEQGGREGIVMVAESQKQGKGRLGRSFYSPKGAGLYMSILLRPDISPEDSLAITTAAAVAVAGAVSQVTGREAKIKWVNDVYLDGKKICGILTEAAIDFENGKLNYAVLGIGVNIQEPPGGFPEGIKHIAGALFQEEPPAGVRAKLAAEILNRFFNYYQALPAHSYMDEYKKRSLLTGLEVTFQQGRETWEGVVIGVDDDARLLVRLPDGQEKAFGAGEVTVVKKGLLEQIQKKT